MLSDLIARYLAAKAIWETQFDEDEKKASDSAEWCSYMELGREIIYFRCSTLTDVQQKASFILADANLIDELTNSSCKVAMPALLLSLADQPVDNRGK